MSDFFDSRTLRVKSILAAAFVFAVATSLGACSDTSQQNAVTGPDVSVSNAKGGNGNDDQDDDGDDSQVYTQVEFLGNPLVSEVTIVKAQHDAYNRMQPYATSTFLPQTAAFVNAFRGGQPAVANTLGAVLYPDMLIVESSRNPATSGWLSWALANGWGGRNLSDDVVDAGLSAIFGKIIVAEGAYCNNFQLPLCTDNVNTNDKSFSGRFPYLADPTL
ncbi:MAG: DUF4331 family protein [Gemmatimonadaceae bacterium]